MRASRSSSPTARASARSSHSATASARLKSTAALPPSAPPRAAPRSTKSFCPPTFPSPSLSDAWTPRPFFAAGAMAVSTVHCQSWHCALCAWNHEVRRVQRRPALLESVLYLAPASVLCSAAAVRRHVYCPRPRRCPAPLALLRRGRPVALTVTRPGGRRSRTNIPRNAMIPRLFRSLIMHAGWIVIITQHEAAGPRHSGRRLIYIG
mmetsp:Transcript_26665/g.78484  ORF Transcript_26665/g.78484 Transcript_26665/m.78484 type:complete len:207 (-) Transcript_26665:13-633(-)